MPTRGDTLQFRKIYHRGPLRTDIEDRFDFRVRVGLPRPNGIAATEAANRSKKDQAEARIERTGKPDRGTVMTTEKVARLAATFGEDFVTPDYYVTWESS